MKKVSRQSLLALGFAFVAGCYHAQTGPLVGYTLGQGPMLGWEGGFGLGSFGGSFGTEIRPFGERVAEGYLAFERSLALPVHRDQNIATGGPYLSLGGTVGGVFDARGIAPMGGAWTGVAWVKGSDACAAVTVPTTSISAGVHVVLDRATPEWTIYATAKRGLFGGCPHLGDLQ